MDNFNQKFIAKHHTEEFDDTGLVLTDNELIQIYNSLGYTMTNVAMLNGFLQDENVLFVSEDNNRSINTIRCKIEIELSRRNFGT